MADTDTLLSLVNEFPAAFSDPETASAGSQPPATPEAAKTQQLLTLVTEFPQAFADPEAIVAKPTSAAIDPEPEPLVEAPIASAPALPPGYTAAIQRRVSTYTWGQIDCYLTYSEAGLQQFWIVVGKSGTEIQSLCEGMARLVNLLLAQQVPVDVIARQLRGMRGGTPEGLGPHQILGLVDLIGKVLQEAPVGAGLIAPATPAPVPASSATISQPEAVIQAMPELVATVSPSVASNGHTNGHSTNGHNSVWQSLSDHDHSASLCPECGAELHQVNGCSGGACTVCGYSSCS
jgi:hypothetical protein